MKCPRDQTELKEFKYEAEIMVDSCFSCHGMFLDKGELEAIQKAREIDYSKELGQGPDASPRPKLSEDAPISCPKCEGEMEKREYGYVSGVVIDTCVAGCGVWLDAGEIQQLEKFSSTIHLKS